jgi:two-component system, cell cycle response regulator
MMQQKKILVVDDDPDIQSLLKIALSQEDRTFITASNGIEAVEKALSELPDLIILDIMMPRMDGYQVCRLLKNEQLTWEIPIIMLSAQYKEKDRLYGISVGADDYLVKPFQTEELMEKVARLLAKHPKEGKACPVALPGMADEASLLSRVNTLLDRKLQEMTFLQYMTKAIVGTFDEDRILRTVLQGIKTEVGYRRCALFMFDDGQLKERLSLGYSAAEKPAAGIAIEYLYQRKEAAVLPRRAGPFVQQCVIPIPYRDEIKGMVLLERGPDEPPFSEDRLNLLSTLAGQLGMALENASMYRTTLHLSITDGLTGLYNARHLYEKLETEITRSKRYGHPLSLFMLDIDFFKKFNDSYGHLSGDEALRVVALVLRENSRETDTVARYGGEEFCVILPETDDQSAEVIAERVRKAMESRPVTIDPKESEGEGAAVNLTVSIGIAQMHSGLNFAEELVRLADKALYQAKREGRNTVRTYR